MNKFLVLQSAIGEEEKLADFLRKNTFPSTNLGARFARYPVSDIPNYPEAIVQSAHACGLDANIICCPRSLREYHLFATDMDSTLVQLETLDEIAVLSGKGQEVSRITELAMQGILTDYSESLRARVALLKGVDAAVIDRVIDGPIQANPGAEELIKAIQAAGLTTILVSGGFTVITNTIKKRFGLDYVVSNELDIDASGKLTGIVTGPNGGPIIDGDGKLKNITLIAQKIGCTLDQVITMGDGSNDIPMLQAAGMSVAWHAKPKVRPLAKQALNFAPLSGILPFFSSL